MVWLQPELYRVVLCKRYKSLMRVLIPKWTFLDQPCGPWLIVYIGLCSELVFVLASLLVLPPRPPSCNSRACGLLPPNISCPCIQGNTSRAMISASPYLPTISISPLSLCSALILFVSSGPVFVHLPHNLFLRRRSPLGSDSIVLRPSFKWFQDL